MTNNIQNLTPSKRTSIQSRLNANIISTSEIYSSYKFAGKYTDEFIYVVICMMLLLISGMLFWGFFNICYIYKECDIHKNLICNISQSTSAPFNPMTEKLFHPWGSSKLNPMAKVFISKEVHNIKQNFGRNIFAPPFYPRQFSCDISVNHDRMENVGLETSISTANIGENLSEESAYSLLHNLRVKNWKKVIIGTLNINSIRNKIHLLADLVIGKLDILLLCETKINHTFPTPQFFISGYSSPCRLDRAIHGGGLLLYVRNDIPSKLLKCSFCEEIECLTIEINIWKKST